MGTAAAGLLWAGLFFYLRFLEKRSSSLHAQAAELEGLLQSERRKLTHAQEREQGSALQAAACLQKAIQRICNEVDSPLFFVFSDDLAWAKNNLQLAERANFIAHNTGTSSYEDMRLMSLWSHNIIANSTFSWWAAWLGYQPGKLVFCPKKWFATNQGNFFASTAKEISMRPVQNDL